jgi:hypothetical protein
MNGGERPVSYRGKSKGNYGNRPRPRQVFKSGKPKQLGFSEKDVIPAKASFEGRSEQSQVTDLSKTPVAENEIAENENITKNEDASASEDE